MVSCLRLFVESLVVEMTLNMAENNLVELIYKKITTLSSKDIKEKIKKLL